MGFVMARPATTDKRSGLGSGHSVSLAGRFGVPVHAATSMCRGTWDPRLPRVSRHAASGDRPVDISSLQLVLLGS
jgi:hypothetical protein